MGEEFDILKGSRNPLPGNLIGLQIGNLFSFKEDFSGVRSIDSGDAIKDRCLDSSVGTYDRIDHALFNLKTDLVEGLDSTEGDA